MLTTVATMNKRVESKRIKIHTHFYDTRYMNVGETDIFALQTVVYFDQQTGAPHAVRWLKSIF